MSQSNAIIHLVDDNPAVLDSLDRLVRSFGLGTRCYSSAEEFLEGFDPDQLGCLVTDVRLPGMSGIELLEQLRRQDATTPVIIVTAYGTTPLGVRAMKRGAVNVLEKPFRQEDLLNAIREALAEDTRLRAQRARDESRAAHLAPLTTEERTVLRGVLLGKTNNEIAAEMDVSLRTVQFRRASLQEKLGIDGRVKLFELAVQENWLDFLSPGDATRQPPSRTDRLLGILV